MFPGKHNTNRQLSFNNVIECNGYIGKVEFDNEAGIFHGEVINLRDVITFQGTCVDELRTAFSDSIEDYLEFCRERGEEPEKPFSGTLFRSNIYLLNILI